MVQQQQAAQERGGISLQYRISRGMPGTGTGRATPPLRMDHFGFTPVETPHGLFRMSVDFAPSSTVTILKETTSPGPVPQVVLSPNFQHRSERTFYGFVMLNGVQPDSRRSF